MIDKNNCSHAKDLLLEEIQEGMTPAGFEIFLEKHADCRQELITFYDVIKDLDELEKVEPSDRMDAKFYAMLASEPKKNLTIKRSNNWLRNLMVAASIFVVGAMVGFYVMQQDNATPFMAEDTTEDKHMILASNSSIHRLEDIAEMGKAPELNDKIIDALNQALINDPNINVRLSAIEAMLHYADNPKVRANLIKAIPYQESPIIQLTLAEVMISLEERNSADEWRTLLKSDKIEADVKTQLEETLAPVLKL
ncbi:HEAT repeat domain-containing protein [Portibacter lacus]|uniref:HEAT repeat domain-containing protein n=1 Tax=Portibacter lacus TaxID=1099794 RepID=A0AA37SQB5_9BACT|nr:HEAT repeat domain-containing protein [Portibacter lacus]GLR17394.1 hypothetical protein GCM10007940_20090 [Portibacter lacus]